MSDAAGEAVGDGEETLPPPDPDASATLPPPDPASSPTVLELPPGLTPAQAETLQVWNQTLQANPEIDQPGMTLKPPQEQLATRHPTLRPTVRIDEVLADEGTSAGEPLPESTDYVIREEIGSGGMGRIYAADQRVLRRRIALKMIRRSIESRPHVANRFVDEALVTGQLEHPNIVPVYDLGRTEQDRLYMGMKLVRGEGLNVLLRQEPATTAPRLRRYLDVLTRVSEAMAYAHAQGVIHRDLKPANVMVGEFGEVLVMDWGLAMRLDRLAEAGPSSGCAGTPAYMSPEQGNNVVEALGPQTDVYLLGAMLYEVLTGTPPHRGDTLMSVILAACQGEIEPPSERAPEREIPWDLEELCLHALAADPAERLPSAEAFREGIEGHRTHSEALGLIQRANDLLEGLSEEATFQERGDQLVRAQVLLNQAIELWPESERAQELSHRARYLQADLALDRGDARAAEKLAKTIRPQEGLGQDQINDLRAAAGRQRTRRRNQILAAAVLLLVAIVLPTWWRAEFGEAQAKRRAQETARRELAKHTREAWLALGRRARPDDIHTALETVRRSSKQGGVRADDLDLLNMAAAWRALRRGDTELALALARGATGKGAELSAADAELIRTRRPLRTAVGFWKRNTKPRRGKRRKNWKPRPPSRHAAALGEAVLIARGVRLLNAAELAAQGPDLGRRLEELGVRGPLADPRSGIPRALLLRGGGVPLPRVTRIFERGPDPIGRARRRPRASLVALHPETGRELWRFPPESLRPKREDAHLTAPQLIRELTPAGTRTLVVVGLGSEVLGLDAERGVVRRRMRLHDRVVALLPSGYPGQVLVVQGPGKHTRRGGQSLLLRCGPLGFVRPPSPGEDLAIRLSAQRELDRQLDAKLGRAAKGPKTPARLRDELRVLADLRAKDPTNPFLPFEEGRRLLSSKRTEEGRARLERLLGADLSAWELTSLALRLYRAHGSLVGDLPERLVARAIAAQVAIGANPGINPQLISNPAMAVRSLAIQVRPTDPERALRLLDLSRELAVALEGDASFMASERRFLEGRGRPEELAAFAPYEAAAQDFGSLWMLQPVLLEAFELGVVAALLIPLLLLAALAVVTARTHRSRVEHLRELGFRSEGSRLLAYVTNPRLRLTRTFLSYATRTELAAFLLSGLAVVLAIVYIVGLNGTIARVAALPGTLARGTLAHPSALGYVHAELERAAKEERPAYRRVVAEALLARRHDAQAREQLDRILRRRPDDPFALNNKGVLLERGGKREEALALYRAAAQAAGPAGAVGRDNLARLEGSSRPTLPVAYRAQLRVTPQAPVRQLVSPADLRVVLQVPRSPLGLLGSTLSGLARSGFAQATGREEGVQPVLELDTRWAPVLLVPFAILLLFTLLHVPFPRRELPAPPSEKAVRRLERIGLFGNLLLPGLLWLARGRVALGMVAAAAGPLLMLLAWLGQEGSVLVAIGLSEHTHPFAPPNADLLVSDTMQLVGPVAGVLALLMYGVAWAYGAYRLGVRVREAARRGGW